MKNFGGNCGNYGGGEGGINPADIGIEANNNIIETENEKYTGPDKKQNLDIAAMAAKIAKEQGLKLNSLERGTGFAS